VAVTFSQAGQYTIQVVVLDGNNSMFGSALLTILVAQVAASISVLPDAAEVAAGDSVQFAAIVFDQFGQRMPDAAVVWSTDAGGIGTVDSQGVYRAGLVVGSAVIRAVVGTASSTAVAQVKLQMPRNLTATPFSNSASIRLTWVDASSGHSRVAIERSVNGAPFVEIAQVEAGVTSYADMNLARDTEYTYRVRTLSATASSDWSAPVTAKTGAFRVLNTTEYVVRPDLSGFGIEDAYIVGKPLFWQYEKGGGYDYEMASEAAVRKAAREAAALNQVLILDIEHWPVDIRTAPDAEVEVTIGKLSRIIDWVRAEAPQVKVGYYGIMPMGAFWPVVRYRLALDYRAANPGVHDPHLPTYEKEYSDWKQANARLAPLAEKVDIIFPSLYAISTEQSWWTDYYLGEMLQEARKFGKPVIPFIWPEYHPRSRFAGQPVAPDFWRRQLNALRQQADGIAIWGGWTYPPELPLGRQLEWDATTPWWQVTKSFMEKLDGPNAEGTGGT